MPYIDLEKRLGAMMSPESAGELNYKITCIIKEYIEEKGEKYQTYNDIMGVLEGAKLELYRRKIGAYEDIKIKDNGDVY